jgi:hypothetical protein
MVNTTALDFVHEIPSQMRSDSEFRVLRLTEKFARESQHLPRKPDRSGIRSSALSTGFCALFGTPDLLSRICLVFTQCGTGLAEAMVKV